MWGSAVQLYDFNVSVVFRKINHSNKGSRFSLGLILPLNLCLVMFNPEGLKTGSLSSFPALLS